MAKKNTAALLVSVAALLISVLSLYFSYLRSSYELEAVVTEFDPSGGVLILAAAVLNQGTQPVIVTAATVGQDRSDNTLYVHNPFEEIRVATELPAVVKEQDLLVVRLEGSLDLATLYERGSSPSTNDGHAEFNGMPTRKIMMAMRIEVLDFLGRRRTADLGLGDTYITPDSAAVWGTPESPRAEFEVLRDGG